MLCSFVSRGICGTWWHFEDVLITCLRSFLCSRRSTWDHHRHFAWQTQHFRRVVLGVVRILLSEQRQLSQRAKLHASCSVTLHTFPLHFTLYTLHSILYTLHFTLHTPHCTLYTPHLHFPLHTLHSTPLTVHFFSPHSSTLYTPDLQLTLYTPHCTLHSLHFTLHTLHFTLHTWHFTLYI